MLDARLQVWLETQLESNKAQIDSQLREEEDQNNSAKASDQLSREASEIPEFPDSTTPSTPSSTATVKEVRYSAKGSTTSSQTVPAMVGRGGSKVSAEETENKREECRDDGGSLQTEIRELLEEQERKIERAMGILEAATKGNRRPWRQE